VRKCRLRREKDDSDQDDDDISCEDEDEDLSRLGARRSGAVATVSVAIVLAITLPTIKVRTPPLYYIMSSFIQCSIVTGAPFPATKCTQGPSWSS
jgi:hypothetical protein